MKKLLCAVALCAAPLLAGCVAAGAAVNAAGHIAAAAMPHDVASIVRLVQGRGAVAAEGVARHAFDAERAKVATASLAELKAIAAHGQRLNSALETARRGNDYSQAILALPPERRREIESARADTDAAYVALEDALASRLCGANGSVDYDPDAKVPPPHCG